MTAVHLRPPGENRPQDGAGTSRSARSPVSPAVLCAGAGYARPTRRITESVCGALAAGGVPVEVEVPELGRPAPDLAQCATRGRAGLRGRVLAGMPALLAANSGSRRPPPDIGPVLRGRLTRLPAGPVPTVVVAGPQDWLEPADGVSGRPRARIEQAAAELAAVLVSRRR